MKVSRFTSVPPIPIYTTPHSAQSGPCQVLLLFLITFIINQGQGYTDPPLLDQGWLSSVGHSASDHDKGHVQRGKELPHVRTRWRALGRREKEKERERYPLPSPFLSPHSSLLIETLTSSLKLFQGSHGMEKRSKTSNSTCIFERCFCNCQVNLDLPPRSCCIFKGRWESSPPRITVRNK